MINERIKNLIADVMEKITFNRKELYEKIWSTPVKEFCDQIDIDPYSLERICGRLNVPMPERTHWKRVAEGKKVVLTPLPEKSKGTETVTFIERNDKKLEREQAQKIDDLLKRIDSTHGPLKDYSFDKLVLSTKEGLPKHWEQAAAYWDKSKMLDIQVSAEARPRAFQFMDLLIKALRLKGHQLIVEKHQMFAVVAGERIALSLKEREKRVEYIDENNRPQKDLRPTGLFYLKREGRAYESPGWSDGPKKGPIEDQILTIIDDLVELAQEKKEDRERWKKSQEEQALRDKERRAHEEAQSKELARFKGLLLNAHRFQLAAMLR